MASRTVLDKVVAILFPNNAFVACGFEHSVANMYFLPIGVFMVAGGEPAIGLGSVLSRLLFVRIGNVLGGAVLVALIYWFVYLRQAPGADGAVEARTSIDAS
ncbi:formate/nitrite transporter family protein [Candidatus Nitrospira bockiana]